MATRKPFVGGNWKMSATRAQSLALARLVAESARAHPGVDVAVFPSFPALVEVVGAIGGVGAERPGAVIVGGQDCSSHPSGAFTGQVSAAMIKDTGCTSVLIGHSERRHGLGESDAVLSKKLGMACENGLIPVLCVGETHGEREAGRADAVIATHLRGALAGHTEASMSALVVAYEPVWAIGTGRTATVKDAAEAHRTVRQTLAELYSARFAEQVRVIYGGSVNAKNAAEIFACEEIDGGLVGGASLIAADFSAIIVGAASRISTRGGF